MLKKVFAATAAVGAGFLMMGTPALATQGDAMDDVKELAPQYDHTHQVGAVNMEDSELLSDLNVCHVDVNVIAVPVLSDNDSGPCVNPDIDVEVEHSSEDDSDR